MMLAAGFLGDLFKALESQLGTACAVLMMFVLPVLVPVTLFIDLNAADVAGSIKRGAKVAALFLLAAALSCLGSLVFMALFQQHLGGFGLGVVHLLVLGSAMIFSKV